MTLLLLLLNDRPNAILKSCFSSTRHCKAYCALRHRDPHFFKVQWAPCAESFGVEVYRDPVPLCITNLLMLLLRVLRTTAAAAAANNPAATASISFATKSATAALFLH